MIKIISVIVALGILTLTADYIDSDRSEEWSEKVYMEYLAYKKRHKKGEKEDEGSDI